MVADRLNEPRLGKQTSCRGHRAGGGAMGVQHWESTRGVFSRLWMDREGSYREESSHPPPHAQRSPRLQCCCDFRWPFLGDMRNQNPVKWPLGNQKLHCEIKTNQNQKQQITT